MFGGTAGSPVAWHGYLQNNGSGPSPYISGNPTYNVVNGVNQAGLTFTVYPVTAHLIGKIVDGSGNPVGNLGIGANTPDPANPNGNYLGTNVTADAGGNFDLGVFGGTAVSPVAWNVNLQNNGTGPSPYVSSNPTFNVVNGVNQTGLIFTVYPVTAHLTGRVLDESNNPIPNLNITAISSSNNNLQSNANVDGSGNFDIPVFGGLWNLSLGNINGLAILPRTNYAVTVVDNVSQSNLVFRVHTIPFNTFIKGKLTGTGGAPISGIQVWATTTYNGNSYSSPYNNQVSTDSNGNYSLPVFAATWSVGVDNAGLSAQGYQAVSNQNAVVTGGGTTTVNFVATHGQTYVVTPSAGGNGGISPNTPQNVVSGGFAVFTATPNSGYVVNQWLVDGSVVQAGGGQYTLFNVGASHGVAVTFKTGTVQTYTLNPFTDGNGFIGPNNPQVISSGGSATFTATPNSGYMVNQWRVDASLAQTGGSSYTISNVTTNHNVQVTFAPSSNLTTWRQTYFPGSTSTTGPGADFATPMNDGVNNLIKFAMGMNPTQPGTMPGTAGVSGGNLTFTYTPSAMAVADGVTFTVTYNDTLAGGAWLSDIVNQGTIGSGGTPVTATVLKGSNGHRFLRLQIASP